MHTSFVICKGTEVMLTLVIVTLLVVVGLPIWMLSAHYTYSNYSLHSNMTRTAAHMDTGREMIGVGVDWYHITSHKPTK